MYFLLLPAYFFVKLYMRTSSFVKQSCKWTKIRMGEKESIILPDLIQRIQLLLNSATPHCTCRRARGPFQKLVKRCNNTDRILQVPMFTDFYLEVSHQQWDSGLERSVDSRDFRYDISPTSSASAKTNGREELMPDNDLTSYVSLVKNSQINRNM